MKVCVLGCVNLQLVLVGLWSSLGLRGGNAWMVLVLCSVRGGVDLASLLLIGRFLDHFLFKISA